MKSELWTRYKDNQKKGAIKSQLCFPWRGFRFVWWTRWGCGWEEVGHRLRPDLMPIQAKKSVMIDTTTWIEITERRQIRFKSVRNHKQESKNSVQFSRSQIPVLIFASRLLLPWIPLAHGEKQSKVWTRDAFLNYFLVPQLTIIHSSETTRSSSGRVMKFNFGLVRSGRLALRLRIVLRPRSEMRIAQQNFMGNTASSYCSCPLLILLLLMS